MLILLHALTIISFFIIGAYATTDIKRLTYGATRSVNNPSCYCDNCNTKLSLMDQIPLVSYLLSKGHCRYCGVKIPFSEFLFEFTIGAGFSVLSYCFSFSLTGYLLVVLCYEAIKLFYILKKGAKEDSFKKELRRSIINNLVIFLILGFIFILNNAVNYQLS